MSPPIELPAISVFSLSGSVRKQRSISLLSSCVKNSIVDFVEEKDGILRHKAYTLDELIEKAKRSGVK